MPHHYQQVGQAAGRLHQRNLKHGTGSAAKVGLQVLKRPNLPCLMVFTATFRSRTETAPCASNIQKWEAGYSLRKPSLELAWTVLRWKSIRPVLVKYTDRVYFLAGGPKDWAYSLKSARLWSIYRWQKFWQLRVSSLCIFAEVPWRIDFILKTVKVFPTRCGVLEVLRTKQCPFS